MARADRPSVTPKEVVVEKDGNVLRLKIPMGLAARLRGRNRRPVHYNPFALPDFPPGVKPAKDSGLAMDDAETITQTINWGAQATVNSAYAEGQVFLGYAQLSMLAQRPEYRKITETIATEATREWIELKSTGTDDKAEKISRLNHLMGTFDLQAVCRKAMEGDGFLGRGHIYVALKDENGTEVEEHDELMHSIGNGRDTVSRRKVTKGSLLAFRNVEAVWCYPTDYNSVNPLAADWYKPKTWHAMGISLDRTRLLTIVSREVPDIIKPTYSFGGLSLTQMCKPYVDNFLRTRQSVSDLVHSFSVSGIKTNLQSLLTPGGQELIDRIDFFNATRDNAGAMLLDKDTEEWFNITTPLSTLDALQGQSLEQIPAIAGIPIVKYLGLQPAGLNASSDGEIRVFYDNIHAVQESVLRPPIQTMLGFIQLSEWGEVDPEIDFEFNTLWQLDEAGDVGVEKSKTDIDDANVAMGAISAEEVRQRLAKDGKSIYHGLDLSIPLPDPDPIDDLGGGIDLNDPHEANSDVPKPREARKVSKYAAMNPKEFVSEVHAGMEAGKTYPEEIMTVFNIYARKRAGTDRASDCAGMFGQDENLATDGVTFTKEEAAYQPKASTQDHCAACANFRGPAACALVAGDIDPEGWCEEFEQLNAEDEFRESDHPRASSGEHGGEFTSGGSSSSSAAKTTSKSSHLVSIADRAKWPAHVKKLQVPPAWTDVRVSQDPKASLQVIGKDAKGRAQYVYSEKFKKSQTDAKFARIKKLESQFGRIVQQNQKAMKSRDQLDREHAQITSLIMDMGLRPGSERETGAKEQAYGATTLRSNHVVKDGDKVKLSFTGKKGVKLDLPVTDPELAKDLLARSARGGQLFPGVTDSSLRRYVATLGGSGFKTKDLRTLKGTKVAADLVSSMKVPASEVEYKKSVMAVAAAVSKELGNTPSVALKAYISPIVFAPWQNR